MHAIDNDEPTLHAGGGLQVRRPPSLLCTRLTTCLVMWETAQKRRLPARMNKQLQMLLVHPLYTDKYHSGISAVHMCSWRTGHASLDIKRLVSLVKHDSAAINGVGYSCAPECGKANQPLLSFSSTKRPSRRGRTPGRQAGAWPCSWS